MSSTIRILHDYTGDGKNDSSPEKSIISFQRRGEDPSGLQTDRQRVRLGVESTSARDRLISRVERLPCAARRARVARQMAVDAECDARARCP